MNQIYNYIQTSVPMKRDVVYPVKSRSDLKRVYNNIVNLSKRSPFYKIEITKENQDYTFGIKETALELKGKLNEMLDPKVSNFDTNTVMVSDEKVLNATLMSDVPQNIPREINIQISSLALAQENIGKELMNDSYALPRGTYLFEAKVRKETYSLIYDNNERHPNLEVMRNLVNYLNEEVPGITASVEKAEKNNYSFIKITANTTGSYEENTFSFQDEEYYDQGIAEFYGLNRIGTQASNAQFSLNGVDKQTLSNTFKLENVLQISLQGVNGKEDSVLLRITPDSEKVLSSVEKVMATYNKLIDLAKTRTQGSNASYNASKLLGEMKGMENVFGEELKACGIKIMNDGSLQLEDSLAVQASMDGGMKDLFTRENGFIARLKDKMEAIAINPMDYLEKTVVLYPNTQKGSFTNPYVTSMYSGLFFNSYC